MKKGIHPQMQWVSVVTQDGRLIISMMPKLYHISQVYQLKAKRQMAESVSRIAKFRQRYGLGEPTEDPGTESGTPNKPQK